MPWQDENRKRLEEEEKRIRSYHEYVNGLGIPNDAEYVDLKGQKYSKKNALQEMLDHGSVIDIQTKDGAFIRRIYDYEHGKVAQHLTDEISGETVNPDTDGPEQLRGAFKALQAEVNQTTHWYMKSSPEYKAFRESLDQLVKGDLSNKAFLYAQMERVAINADRYLASKEKPEAKITDNTVPRMLAAHRISMMLKGSLAPVIEKGIDIHNVVEDNFELVQDFVIIDEDSDHGVGIDEEFVKQVGNDVEPDRRVEPEAAPVENEVDEPVIDDDDIIVEVDSDMVRE